MPPRVTRASKRAAEAEEDVKPAAKTAAKPAAKAQAVPATPAKRGRATKATSAPASVKRGLGGHAAPATNAPLGAVDPASGITAGHILNRDDDVYDVMLSLVDLSKNSDKYYLLQVIISSAGDAYTWARWGRTGTAGQSQIWKAKDEDDAIRIFADKYKEKTGSEWEDHANFVLQPGKYKLLKTDHVAVANKAAAVWQYYVDDGVDGKADGWYDYDAPASAIVERLHDEWLYNQELSQRLVDSGNWTYSVDLRAMSQTNTSTQRVRNIRRQLLAFKNQRKGAAAAAAAVAKAAAKLSGNKRSASAAAAAAPPAPTAPATPPAKRSKAAASSSPSSAPTKSRVSGANVSASAAAAAAGSGSVDPACPHAANGTVEEGFDVMLNQTDIGANKNKFYLAQLVETSGQYWLWTRWGRVGEAGATQLQGPFDFDDGAKEFKKKFRAKTGNDFDDRDNFVAKPGKYELIALQGADEDIKQEIKEEEKDDKSRVKIKLESTSSGPAVSKLDPSTKSLVEFIFDLNMFQDAMAHMELDVKRMPLGRLSKAQVQRGMDVLEELEAELNGKANRQQLQLLSSKFYQVIPHSFGRTVPPVIASLDTVRQKYDLCNVLQDIEAAQQMMSSADTDANPVHPADAKYAELKTDLQPVAPGSEEYNMIKTYLSNTMHKSYSRVTLKDVWRADRQGEKSRFSVHDAIGNRKLLWHGTNVAVVAAILKSGLRIMPHSGGRVGSGIYMASEAGKSIWYVRGARGPGGKEIGIMFLVEAVLGKEHSITQDDWRLKAAPPGYDSIVARGRQEPDSKLDTEVTLDGHKVVVPQGKPVPISQYKTSSFDQTEYLIYQESQHRLRYVLTVNL